VTLHLLPDKISVEKESSTLVTQLIPGDFPDIDNIIPESPATSLKLHKEELMTLLRQIALFMPSFGHSVQFTFQEGELKLNATSSEIGEGQVSMPVDYHGDQLVIAFNPLLFHDILRHCEDEVVSLALFDPYNPGLISDSKGAEFVLMPMRLQSSIAP
jgi:DNA polymerase III subunit beta